MNPIPVAASPVRVLLATGAVIAFAGALTVGALLAGLLGSGDPGEPIEAGTPVTITFSDGPRMVWSTTDTEPACEPGGQVSTSIMPTRDQDITTHGWRGLLLLTASPPGDHEWTCTAPEPARLSVGTPPLIHDARGQVYAIQGITALTAAALTLTVLAARRPT
ncbi:hypothetical protein [Actinoplanes couchii]|uniref:Uncharacterized protein n=1 Tax=Actinoplanes couchii TaxID=403638 RepID=A0ABQ3X238_9ACTN|nr:hypothetical protein [Actinoplanes couchii]MDR6316976.1 hypothetical protein [Actinoplanes couchii]GID52584.1 hypothetical protein Aco03nite_009880 [Actinoplanes couchii]